MKQTMKNNRLSAVAATLGMVLALGGATHAVAQSSTDAASRDASVASEAAGISPVIGKSWTSWVRDPVGEEGLPATAPRYTQVNFLTNPYGTGGMINTAQGGGQMHVNATVQLHKNPEGGNATVICDVRVDGSHASQQYVTTLTDAAPFVTIPLTGAKTNLAAGTHNAGVRCWAPTGYAYMESVDLHAVVYGPAQ